MITEAQMTLATDQTSQWVGGWYYSEKLNGCRAYWTGKEFFTRGGNIIPAPKWFTKGLPDVHLDGEIWAGRKGFQDASKAVRFGGKWFDVPEIQFAVFDAPQVEGTWRQRMAEARQAVHKAACAVAVPFERVRDVNSFRLVKNDYAEILMRFHRLGSEGVMFRHPDAIGYDTGRSKNLLRVKFGKD